MFSIKKIQTGICLANYTTFKIGGRAKYFFIAISMDEAIDAIKWALGNNEKIFILGGGSNVLFSGGEFNGLVIKMNFGSDILIKENKEKSAVLSAGAGCQLSKLLEFLKYHSLTGLEWAAGIPGTLGGAIRGNAEAFGECMGDLIKSADVLDISKNFKNIKLISLSKKKMRI
ncbi:MAG: FAD-binding protein [bacterium]